MSAEVFGRPFSSFGSAVTAMVRTLLARNKLGAMLRLLIFSSALAFYWILLVFSAGFPGELPAAWQTRLGSLPFFALNLLAPFFHPTVLIHLIPVLAGMLAGLFIIALFLSDLFELESVWIALHYLLGSVFGVSYPTLQLNRGDIELLEAENATNPLVRIGGPGYLRVHLGYAALTESQAGIPQVYAPPLGDQDPSSTFLDGFERLRSVIDLRDQLGVVDQVEAITRDGIEVRARDAQMLFRVHSGGKPRSLQTPFPYTEEALRRLTYGQAVETKRPHRWEQFLPSIVRAEIRSFVARHSMEEFLALQPDITLESDEPLGSGRESKPQPATIHIPRRRLTDHFHTPELVRRLEEIGLELDWVGVGTWELGDEPPHPEAQSASPASTLLATWRDLQRATIHASPDYQARQRKRGYHETLARVLSRLVATWKHGDFPGAYRCYGLLQSLYDDLGELYTLIQSQPDGHIPPGVTDVFAHFEALKRPREIGGSDARNPAPES